MARLIKELEMKILFHLFSSLLLSSLSLLLLSLIIVVIIYYYCLLLLLLLLSLLILVFSFLVECVHCSLEHFNSLSVGLPEDRSSIWLFKLYLIILNLELRPLVRLFAIDSNNNVFSVSNWSSSLPQLSTRSKRQTPSLPSVWIFKLINI